MWDNNNKSQEDALYGQVRIQGERKDVLFGCNSDEQAVDAAVLLQAAFAGKAIGEDLDKTGYVLTVANSDVTFVSPNEACGTAIAELTNPRSRTPNSPPYRVV